MSPDAVTTDAPCTIFFTSLGPPPVKNNPLYRQVKQKIKKVKKSIVFFLGGKTIHRNEGGNVCYSICCERLFFLFCFSRRQLAPPPSSASSLSPQSVAHPPPSRPDVTFTFCLLSCFFSASYCVVKWRVITAMLVWREKKWNVWSSFSCARLCPMATISRVTWYTSSRRYRGWLISASFSFCLSLTRPFSVSCRHRFQDGDAQFFKHFSRKDLAAEPSGRRRFYFT